MEGALERRDPGRVRSADPAEVDRLLEAWVDAWQALMAELHAAGGGIDARLRERSRQAQRILAANPAIGRWLADLDKPRNEIWFRAARLRPDEAHIAPVLDRAWLARMRETASASEKLEAEDWSGPIVPGARILSAVEIDGGQDLADFLLSLRHASPPEKWLARARAIASGRHGRRVRKAIIFWLETLPVAGDPATRERLWPDALAFRTFRNRVIEDTALTGSAEAAALIAFFDPSVRFPAAPGGSLVLEPYSRNPALLSERAARLVRGAAWMLTHWRDGEVVAALQKAAEAMLARIDDGTTYRSLLAANACLLALGEVGSPDSVQALGRIKLRIRDERLAKQIAKAMEAAAARAGITVDELQELSAPDHGLDEVGGKSVRLGDFSATLRVLSTTRVAVELARADGTPVKTVPSSIRSDPKRRAALKQLKDLAKEVAQALPVHRQRLDGLYLTRRSWPAALWRERYLDHPAVGTIARRLIWTVAEPHGGRRSVLWHEERLVDAQGVAAKLPDDATVTLWHPLEAAPGEVASWRAFLMEQRLVQPFKQAHRELYPLTDAERATALYSNRFAGHILRQHQSVALARLRGWRATLRVCADVPNDQPTHIRIPDYGLAAELWTEAAGGDAPELNDSGIYVFIATDRVRFRVLVPGAEGRAALGDPVPLDAVPPRVFSEVMRDVDLFVGVASIGNDPAWIDRGADAGHPNQWARDYWYRQAAGPLNASGENRSQLLAEVIPSLAIADRCTFSDRYLVVRGRLGTYRIHLGSGNVLMDNDRYLCIVQPRGARDAVAFLPFEGDGMLSLILSKAVVLAADDQISDATILSQLKR